MSVEKVNKYKESKKNRKQEIEKQKRTEMIRKYVTIAVAALVAAALVFGIVLTIVNAAKANKAGQSNAYVLDEMDLMDYANMEGTTAEETTAEE